jgi:retron-type reverse transcriptase
MHLIDVDFLREAYRLVRKDGAPGVDKVTAEEYAVNLDENLRDLCDRLRSGRYKAPPVERGWVEKDETSKRPIGKPTFEDKIAQRAGVMLLGAIYEQDFCDFSYGFREGRSPHQALKELWDKCMRMNIGWVLDADVSGFLDTSSYYTPFHDGLSKRLVWLSNTLIRMPFRLPRRTWTAGSCPRFTRCNTVWRETPRILMASRIGT